MLVVVRKVLNQRVFLHPQIRTLRIQFTRFIIVQHPSYCHRGVNAPHNAIPVCVCVSVYETHDKRGKTKTLNTWCLLFFVVSSFLFLFLYSQ